MKYHGFFLVTFAIFFLIWLVLKWLDYWKWNCKMADKKNKEVAK